MTHTSAAEIIQQARARSRLLLTEVEAKALLSASGVAVAQARLARTREEAITLARDSGFPVVLKVCSPDVIHKSDVGGVKLSLASAEDVSKAFDDIMRATTQGQRPTVWSAGDVWFGRSVCRGAARCRLPPRSVKPA